MASENNNKRGLLAPIILNAPPTPKKRDSKNGISKNPNPNPTLTTLEPNPLPRRSSKIMSHLEEMEPPPPIPAAIEEQGYRSRPSSSHSQRCNDDTRSDDGFIASGRRGSVGSGSTTAWAENSPGGSNGGAGPSGGTRRGRRRGFFRTGDNNSTASVDGGDEMEYAAGVSTPRSRRSVIFSQSGDYSGGEEPETPIANKRPGFFQRLKNFGGGVSGSHGRSLSGWTVDTTDESPVTPGPALPFAPYSPVIIASGAVTDAGAESEDVQTTTGNRSPAFRDGTVSAPATPRPGERKIRRRATTTNTDDGNDTDISKRSGYGFSRRPSFKHRITKRRSTDGGERSSYMPNYKDSAAKWKALKAGLRMIGNKRPKPEDKIDQQKSAELVAELSAATPAAVILASMFQRDEHGHKRIPILLEQLKVQITDSHHSQKGAGRAQTTFRLELEYGSGLTRMKWVIYREFRDFFNLHSRYRLADISDTTFSGKQSHKLPKFPRGTIPYLRGVRGLGSDDESGEGETSCGETQNAAPRSGRKRRPLVRRMSSTAGDLDHNTSTGVAAGLAAAAAAAGGASVQQAMNRREGFNIRQRQQLEDYMRRLVCMMVFRPDSNRLCKFLELSALGVRLAAEGSYHGKEGYLIIRSSKGSDFRRPWNPSQVARRHAPKWFLVRHSYIVCVDSPEEMNIYDVFLVDSNFSVDTKRFLRRKQKDPTNNTPSNPARPQHHRLTIKNHERTIKLLAKNDRQLQQFQSSINLMKNKTNWAKIHRFHSFAPVRKGVFAQWLVDGRDYFWNVSRAISMAKDVIYIHDWWLSPELYLRRPAAVSQKWRLDRLLQRKAQEGVKIFVIVYRNIGAAVPIDSAYTKYSLLDLHPNVYVQRSPNQIRQQTFFWAHHEKILVVDHMIAFVGGIDLCFGRWDTPQHAVGDDKPSGFEEGSAKCDPNNFQLWPGKDYSNPRVQDFFNLDKPYEDMYDREKVPRMPWHDIHMQIVGQPARDLTRHFVQRWNYLLRQRTPSRPTPLLLPPPDFTNGELESLGIDGSCEIQILRSACSWSLGTQSLIECSIQNAYLKSIEMSEHLVYIENQFFITSTEFENTRIENKIGDALVERIVRAAKNDEDWRAIIILPLMPGFESAIDAQDGTSVRLIMNCQFRSISQGENSIFGRLRVLGIEPEDYIQFFGLRNWGKIGKGKLVTEQLYIHAKCMVVDDRIAIIGSANINERSMLGNRDSEVAAIVRDTDTIVSTMAGQSYRVGRFPHTLRVRLMREHLGLDVDAIMQDELEEARGENGGENGDAGWEDQVKRWQDETAAAIIKDHTREAAAEEAQSPLRQRIDGEAIQRMEMLRSFNHDVDWEQQNNPNLRARQKGKADPRVTNNPDHQADVRGFGADHMIQRESERASLSVDRTPLSSPKLGEFSNKRNPSISLMKEEVKEMDTSASPSAGKAERSRPSSPIPEKVSSGNITPSCPTKRFDSIELGLPQLPQLPPLPITGDEEAGGPSAVPEIPDHKRTPSAPLPTLPSEFRCPEVAADMFSDPLNDSFYLDVWHKIAMNNTEIYRQVFRCQPDNEIKTWASYKEAMDYSERFSEAQERRAQSRAGKPEGHETTAVSNEKDAADYKEMPNGTTVEFTSTGIRLNLPDGDGTSLHSLNEKIGSNGSTRPRGNSYVSTRLNTATTATSTSTIQLSYSRGSQESKEKQPADPNLLQGTASVTYAHPNVSGTNTSANGLGYSNTRRRRRGTTRSSRTAAGNIMDLDLAEKMLGMVQGHLVIWPHDWLAKEQATGNWLYNIDQLAPIEIYD